MINLVLICSYLHRCQLRHRKLFLEELSSRIQPSLQCNCNDNLLHLACTGHALNIHFRIRLKIEIGSKGLFFVDSSIDKRIDKTT